MQSFTVIDNSGIFTSISEIPDRVNHTYKQYTEITFIGRVNIHINTITEILFLEFT
jgi:hypothetical protein